MAIAIRPHAFTMSGHGLADPEWAQVLSDSVKDDPKAFAAVETLLAERKQRSLAGSSTTYWSRRQNSEMRPPTRSSATSVKTRCGSRGELMEGIVEGIGAGSNDPGETSHGSRIVGTSWCQHGDAAGRRSRMAGRPSWIAPCNPRPPVRASLFAIVHTDQPSQGRPGGRRQRGVFRVGKASVARGVVTPDLPCPLSRHV